jgi:type 1 glutamine amidotransferase
MMRSFWLLLSMALLCAAIGVPTPVRARNAIDCPLRDQAYSIDSPLIDVLLKPEAKAAVEREAPTLLSHLPPTMAATTTPSFASIVTLRIVAQFEQAPEESLSPVADALAALPITAADREARCARYDDDRPHIEIPKGHPRLLLFEKITGFRDEPSVQAAGAALRTMAARNDWSLVATDKGGAMTASVLKKFDVVIWNNVSADVLTLTERSALKRYIERGGGFVAFHGAGGDPVYFWDWYVDTLIGARFVGHTMAPQFQEARVVIDDDKRSIAHDLAPGWDMTDEWYSFKASPRTSGAHVIATLNESTYSPIGMGKQDLRMGDHPIAWTKCIGDGRSFYSAIGHRPETYSEPHNVKLLEHAILWAVGAGPTHCKSGKEG